MLTLRSGAAALQSRGQAGLFYGCQTLQQLLEDARDTGKPIPAMKITDWPELSYRALHIDTKHHLDTLDYYYDFIDRMAGYKLNAIIWEFEDKLGYRSRPSVAAAQHITLEEMAALTHYARRRHIEISPLVQGLGHATFILKQPEYEHLREKPGDRWAFCPMLDETYEVQFDLYRDAMLATPGSRYLHVGGDEVHVGSCPRCKPIADKEGAFVLNLRWLNKVCAFAREHGRIPIFWDDMIFNHAGVYRTTHSNVPHEQVVELWEKGLPKLDVLKERFPKDCVYMRWNYTLARQEGNLRALDWYRDMALPAMIATAAQNSRPLLPQADRVDVIQSFNSLAAERGIDSMLCTAWDDASPHMETYWRGFGAAGEFSWNPTGRSLDEYEVAWLQRAFGPDATGATALYDNLSESVDYWVRALCAEGDRMHPRKLMNLPDPKAPGAWSEQHKDRLEVARKMLEQSAKNGTQLDELMKTARRNRFHLELLSAANGYQATSARLLVALAAADAKESADGRGQVAAALDDFDARWQKLREVYGRTRCLDYPGYLVDHYHHYASPSENLDWLRNVELKLHPEVRAWLKETRS